MCARVHGFTIHPHTPAPGGSTTSISKGVRGETFLGIARVKQKLSLPSF